MYRLFSPTSIERILQTFNGKETYQSLIIKKSKLTVSYVDKVITIMEKIDLLKRLPKEGTRRKIVLTEKGKRLKKLYSEINELMKDE